LAKLWFNILATKNAPKDTLMKFTAFTKKVIFALLLVSSGGTLFASEVDELRERAKAMQTKAALLAEQGDKEQAQRIQNEAAKLLEMAKQLETNLSGRREKEFARSIDKEAFQLKDRLQDLLNKERIMRDEHASESELMNVRGEIADIERALKKIQDQHAERSEHRSEFRAQVEKLERVGRRLHHLRVAAEHLKFAEEHDLAHKLMTKAQDIERDLHAAKKRLATEMQPELEQRNADRPEFVTQLKEENERLRAELRELKQKVDNRIRP
jgi:DNA repair exonuclease SbcCD ATPase subunit